MRVKHGAKVELTLKTGRKILDRTIVPVEDIGAQMTVWGFMVGNISGMVNLNWMDKSITAPKVGIKLVNPDDELKNGELCNCSNCKEDVA